MVAVNTRHRETAGHTEEEEVEASFIKPSHCLSKLKFSKTHRQWFVLEAE